MSQISVKDLTFSYEGSCENLFEKVNFNIDTDWKLGLIGRNGRGKTTLLKLISGQNGYTGKISSSVEFTYFPFRIDNENQLSRDVISELCPDAEEWQIQRELNYLKMTGDILYRPFSSLSYGERTKLLLAGLFLNNNGFRLIDEPTNHLDGQSRETVAKYLNRKNGFIIVSHDRAFLDECTDHIMSINKTGIEIIAGNFTVWKENYERRQTFEFMQNEKLTREVKRLKETALRTTVLSNKIESGKNGIQKSGLKADKGFVGHKAAKIAKRANVINSRRENALLEKSKLLKDTETADALKLAPLIYEKETLIALSNTTFYYNDKQICAPLTFTIKRGDRIALSGINGCGKSTVLKAIVDKNIKYNGIIKIGSGLKISYVPQNTDYLRGDLSELANENDINLNLLMAVLFRMDFKNEDFIRDLSTLSQGQKKKVLLAKSLCESAHIYIWDEPLNYIDIYSRIQIESLITDFRPTMLFIEHDKQFREKISTQIIEM